MISDDIESVKRNWADFFGTDVPPTLPGEGYKDAKTVFMDKPAIGASSNNAPFEFGEGTDLELEVLRPVGRVPSEWENFFVEHGPGIHHIAFSVTNIDEKIERAAQMGFKCRQHGYFGRGIGRYAYLDTQMKLKTTVELIEIFPEKIPIDAPFF